MFSDPFGTPLPKVKPKPIGEELKDREEYILPTQGCISRINLFRRYLDIEDSRWNIYIRYRKNREADH